MENLNSPIIIRGVTYLSISKTVIKELEDWLAALTPLDRTNFKTLIQNPSLGRKFLDEVPDGEYSRMLRLALQLCGALK